MPRRSVASSGGVARRVVWCLLTLPCVARAQPVVATPTPDPVRAFDAAMAEALVPLAAALDPAVAQLPPDQRAAGVCLRGELGPARQGALVQALDAMLSAHGLRRVGVPADLCARRTDAALVRASGVSLMLDVAWTLARGDVTLRAEALLSDEGPWARFLRPPSTDTRSLHAVAWTVSNPVARAGLDVPLPNLWPIVGTGEAPRTVATPFRDVVALVAGDLDGVAGDELVVVTSTTAYVGRFERGALRFSSAGGHSLGPAGWASVPRREPFGVATYAPDTRTVRLRTGALASTATLRLVGNTVEIGVEPAPDDRWPVPSDDGRACAVLQGDRVVRLWRRCGEGLGDAPPEEGMHAALPVVRGSLHGWCNGAGLCTLWEGPVQRGTLQDAAWPMVLVDLADTGQYSFVTASAAPPGSADTVRSLVPVGEGMRPGARVTVPGPVTAFTSAQWADAPHRVMIAAVSDPARRTSTLWVWP